jgi:EamA domain-containing membrane protein RarD
MAIWTVEDKMIVWFVIGIVSAVATLLYSTGTARLRSILIAILSAVFVALVLWHAVTVVQHRDDREWRP